MIRLVGTRTDATMIPTFHYGSARFEGRRAMAALALAISILCSGMARSEETKVDPNQEASSEAVVVAELRRQLAEKDRQIAELREQLDRQQGDWVGPLVATPQAIRTEPNVEKREYGSAAEARLAAILDELDSPLVDNFDLFLGLDGSKQPQDFGVNAHFGGRFSVNYGFALLERWGIGAQVGTALVQSHNAVQVFERIGESTDRFQVYTTLGLFQRTKSGFNWAIAYDLLHEEYFDTFNLGQWRGRFGYQLTPKDEFGVRLMLSGRRDGGFFKDVGVTLDPITMATGYWRHTFWHNSNVTFWGGLAEGHTQANIVLGDQNRIRTPFVFGAELDIPLGEHISLFGQANFIRPTDTGTVDAFLGLAFHPSKLSTRGRSARYSPPQAVAGSPTFAVDLSRHR
jgi:Family of unknown function (DUF6666)